MSLCGLVSMSPVSMNTRREPQKPGDAVIGSCELSNGGGGWGLDYFFSPCMYYIAKLFFEGHFRLFKPNCLYLFIYHLFK